MRLAALLCGIQFDQWRARCSTVSRRGPQYRWARARTRPVLVGNGDSDIGMAVLFCCLKLARRTTPVLTSATFSSFRLMLPPRLRVWPRTNTHRFIHGWVRARSGRPARVSGARRRRCWLGSRGEGGGAGWEKRNNTCCHEGEFSYLRNKTGCIPTMFQRSGFASTVRSLLSSVLHLSTWLQ